MSIGYKKQSALTKQNNFDFSRESTLFAHIPSSKILTYMQKNLTDNLIKNTNHLLLLYYNLNYLIICNVI